eukprot:Rmarinus@m.19121
MRSPPRPSATLPAKCVRKWKMPTSLCAVGMPPLPAVPQPTPSQSTSTVKNPDTSPARMRAWLTWMSCVLSCARRRSRWSVRSTKSPSVPTSRLTSRSSWPSSTRRTLP